MSAIKLRTSSTRIGIWSLELRFGDRAEAADAAAELEELGFSAIWIPGGVGGDLFGDVERLLSATQRAVIATGILNIWKHTPQEVCKWWGSLSHDRRSRALLGIGVSHSPLIGEAYRQPLVHMLTTWGSSSKSVYLPRSLPGRAWAKDARAGTRSHGWCTSLSSDA